MEATNIPLKLTKLPAAASFSLGYHPTHIPPPPPQKKIELLFNFWWLLLLAEFYMVDYIIAVYFNMAKT